jgi:hypothetical protein
MTIFIIVSFFAIVMYSLFVMAGYWDKPDDNDEFHYIKEWEENHKNKKE